MARRTTGGTRREYLGLLFDHHGEVGHQGEGCGRAGDRAHYARSNRHALHQFNALPPEIAAGQAHVPGGFVRLRAVSHSLNKLYVGDAVLRGERLRELARVLADIVRAAA